VNIESPLLRDALYSLYRTYSGFFAFYPPPKVFVNSVRRRAPISSADAESGASIQVLWLHIENRRFLKDLSTAQNPDREPEFDMACLERSVAKCGWPIYHRSRSLSGSFVGLVRPASLQDHYGCSRSADIAVSHAKYVGRLKRHILHERFVRMADDDERLMTRSAG